MNRVRIALLYYSYQLSFYFTVLLMCYIIGLSKMDHYTRNRILSMRYHLQSYLGKKIAIRIAEAIEHLLYH